eukprot:scaffold136352_cov148-Phaeocystis_antarctica.AAC.1
MHISLPTCPLACVQLQKTKPVLVAAVRSPPKSVCCHKGVSDRGWGARPEAVPSRLAAPAAANGAVNGALAVP